MTWLARERLILEWLPCTSLDSRQASMRMSFQNGKPLSGLLEDLQSGAVNIRAPVTIMGGIC